MKRISEIRIPNLGLNPGPGALQLLITLALWIFSKTKVFFIVMKRIKHRLWSYENVLYINVNAKEHNYIWSTVTRWLTQLYFSQWYMSKDLVLRARAKSNVSSILLSCFTHNIGIFFYEWIYNVLVDMKSIFYSGGWVELCFGLNGVKQCAII